VLGTAALRSRLPLGVAVVAAVGLIIIVAAGALSGRDDTGPLRFDITIRDSHYDPASITVPTGRPVTFVIHNIDPIDHEWILGDPALHAMHRTGTEAVHVGRANELSIAALATVETTLTFTAPRTDLSYVCHLPGHEAYGMVGTLIVTN
jgi:uncharacterized cupredoxin-like copper-binding protein